MKWRKASEWHAISDCGGYKIAKWLSMGEPAYLLSCRGETLGWHDSAKEAQRAAEIHRGGDA